MNILSLGAGVQSSTMALMAAHGEIEPMPECAIFADTQWEPAHVYKWLDFISETVPFPVHRVSAGDIRAKAMLPGYSDIPWHTDKGIGRRQCTKVFKLYPLRDKVKDICGVTHGRYLKPGAVNMWIGISTDEFWRQKPSTVKYIKNCWPLIDKGMTRSDCLEWMGKQGYPLPEKSACIGCPLKSDSHWRETRNDAKAWLDAIAADEIIRNTGKHTQYMHHSKKPLKEVDLRTLEDKGQLNLFNNECEGLCGV